MVDAPHKKVQADENDEPNPFEFGGTPETDAADDETSKRRLRGHVKLQVMNWLAAGNRTHQSIADEVGVSRPVITRFAARNGAWIRRIQEDAANDLAGLWIADKALRIAEFQQQVEDVRDLPVETQLSDPALVRNAQRALRAVAEELGALPVRTSTPTGDGGTLHYDLPGVDMDRV